VLTLTSDFTQKRAAEFGLKGWVKNTTDGLVCLPLSFSSHFLIPSHYRHQ